MTQTFPKRLIEVDLPIKRISAHARREKSIRHGHISTLHIWWARRPLAACRAVICASLWPDPADELCPTSFRDKARAEMLAWTPHERQRLLSEESQKRFEKARQKPALFDDAEELRGALLDFIADFANWDNSTVKEYLETSRALTQSAHEALGGAPGTRPLVVDPFAGGGSIPLEALRVGADAFASDLNPVAVLLNKVVLEYIPKYGQRLADEVRKWGEWIKREAETELAEFYPRDADGATPIAYLWARTIQCEGPGCGITVPLFTSPWLCKKPGNYVWIAYIGSAGGLAEFDIRHSSEAPLQGISGTIRKGTATCPSCGYTTPMSQVKKQLSAKRGGATKATLLVLVVSRTSAPGRHYRRLLVKDLETANNAGVRLRNRHGEIHPPTQLINSMSPGKFGSGVASPTRIGCETFADLFTERQLLSLCSFAERVSRLEDAAVRTLLAFAVDRMADYNSAQSRWAAAGEFIGNTFGRQAIPIVWSFAEINPFSGASGDWDGAVGWIASFVEHAAKSLDHCGNAMRGPAAQMALPDDAANAIITDPPYYGSILYSDLADYFYVWLKQTLGSLYPDMFTTDLVDKENEAVATPTAVGPHGEKKDASFFESAMSAALADNRRVLNPTGIGVVVFAHKSTSGWEALLTALIQAGWVVTASWPIDTERQARTNAHGTATLASSVHLVCRPREHLDGSVRTDEIGDWRDVLQELPRRIHEWMPRLAEEGVVGADAIFACIGPALEIFSRYSRVEKASGETVTLKEYLEAVWAAVAKEALTIIFPDADTVGFEEDARLTAMWLWTLNAGNTNGDSAEDEDADDESEGGAKKAKVTGFILEYDAARKIAQGLGAHLEDLDSLVEVSGETARLLPVGERARSLFGKEEGKVPALRKKREPQMNLFKVLEEVDDSGMTFGETKVARLGETVLDRIHQSMILFAAGRGEALKNLLVDNGVGQDQRFWRLAQALSALYPSHTEEKRWVDGVLARKKGLGF